MQATKFPSSSIIAPGQRYHPAIVAQGIATLAEMFPNRFEIELGSGEALNESITVEQWPEKSVRNDHLLECNNIIRDLLNGKTVNHEGLVKVKEAKTLHIAFQSAKDILCSHFRRNGQMGRKLGGWDGYSQ